MTLDDAIGLRDKWKVKCNGHKCQHNQLFDHLRSANGQNTDYKVCLVCGEIYLDLQKPLSPAELQTLGRLFAKEK